MSYAYADRKKALMYLGFWTFIAFLLFWAMLFFVLPFSYYVGNNFSPESWADTQAFLKRATANPFYVLSQYGSWFWRICTSEPRHYEWASFIMWRLPMLPTLLFLLSFGYFLTCNPYSYSPQYFGYGREARPGDIKKMKLDKGKYLFLGNYGKKIKMRLPDTRSAFCIGAPCSGKTTGVIIPNILMADNACLFIHDPTGQLRKLTSGYRATLGPVYNMDFSLADKPQEGLYYPCWNPLSSENMPPQHKGRDGYIDTLVEYLIPDGPVQANYDGREGTDPYWVKSGRSCLTGLTIYVTNKVEQAKANDYFVARLNDNALDDEDLKVLKSYYQGMQQTPDVENALKAIENKRLNKFSYVPVGTWDPLPHNWVGKEASFGMLLDLLNNWMFAKTKELRARRDSGDFNAVSLDVWQEILDSMVNEVFFYGYSRRALLELNQVYALPDKQRSSVLSMAQSGIELFKNSSIRQRTSSNDFSYKDFRGVKDEKTGEYRPFTVYVNNEGGSVCSLFINMISGYLMEHGQNEGGVGPYAVEFILDDFGRMPKLQSIADGVTFGRSKGNVYLVCVQDWHQISAKYGEDTTDVVLSSVAAKIIKRQNNIETRNKVTAGMMSLTRIVENSHGGEVGFSKDVNPFVTKGGIKRIKDSVIGGTGIMNMAINKQLVLYAAHYHQPIRGETPLYYKDKEFLEKTKIPQADNVPADLKARKEKEQREYIDIQLDSLTGNG
ncbi:MAG: type IV secretory system conjugative DNA transfer family protein [Alphaproteobacteria bacterium]|nr:type IV secretory system conjugative DNA transfer family protein [Alphaproteobacteria bacterium]